MSPRSARASAVLGSLLGLVAGGLRGVVLAQQPQATPSPPTFPADVELVTVDVVVTDSRGAAVAGLAREDFVLREDGRPQSIESFEAVTLPPRGAPTAPRGRVATNVTEPARAGRTYALLFDDLNLSPFLAPRARLAISRFLEGGTRAGDRVLLASTGGDAWWSAVLPEGSEQLAGVLKRLDGRSHPDNAADRITPWEAMRIHLYRDREVAARVSRRLEASGALMPMGPDTGTLRDEYRFNFEHPLLLSRAQQVYLGAVARNRVTLEALERCLEALAVGHGRKALVLLSEGFFHDPNMEEFKRVLEASRRANAALYFLDARGLAGMPVEATAEFAPTLGPRDLAAAFDEGQQASEGTELIASDSGGFSLKNSNDLDKGFARIAAESEAYYLLGYRSDNRARDGRFRRIRVEVRRKGVEIRARNGYYAALEGEPVAAQARVAGDRPLETALNSPFDQAGLPLRAAAFAFEETLLGKARVVLAVEVDVRGLALREVEGRLVGELDQLVVASHLESGEYVRFDQKVELKLLPEALGKLGRDWYAIARDLELAAGRYQARIVVRDRSGGRVGAVSNDFEVPALAGLRISTPVLGDTLHQVQGGGPHPVLVLRRSFPAGAVLYAEYQVYGAARDPASGQPRVSAGFELRRPDGVALMRVAPTTMRPTSLGQLSRIVVAPLRGAPPGDYLLVLQVRDEVAGTGLEASEPFAVEAGDGP
jgi:VWFA-related protein